MSKKQAVIFWMITCHTSKPSNLQFHIFFITFMIVSQTAVRLWEKIVFLDSNQHITLCGSFTNCCETVLQFYSIYCKTIMFCTMDQFWCETGLHFLFSPFCFSFLSVLFEALSFSYSIFFSLPFCSFPSLVLWTFLFQLLHFWHLYLTKLWNTDASSHPVVVK